jgi:hypothetical protein
MTTNENETPRDKFLRIATLRTEKAVHHIELIEHLAGNGYDYEPAMVDQILDALTKATTKVKTKFEAKSQSGRPAFTFR